MFGCFECKTLAATASTCSDSNFNNNNNNNNNIYIYIYIAPCPWNCRSCSDTATCATCKLNISGLEKSTPCGCNSSLGYLESIPGTCTIDNPKIYV